MLTILGNKAGAGNAWYDGAVVKFGELVAAAVHQLENRPLDKVSIGSLLGYLQALGYDVDEEWIAETLVRALPAPTT